MKARPQSMGSARLAAGLLILLTVVTYWPLLSSDFTNWDDQETIVHNRWLNPPRVSHFLEFWNPRKPFMDIWIPMTYTVWSAVAAIAYVPTPDPETRAFLNPWIFHGANVAVHAISVLLVFALLRRLTGKAWPAAVGAALFAVHPVQVEPIGWLSGMKDLLCGCFSLLAIEQYIRFAQSSPKPASASSGSTNGLHYGFATLAAVLAMLSKPAGVALPLVIAVIDVCLLLRGPAAALRALGPWLVIAALFMIEGRFAQPPLAHRYVTPVLLRPLIATDALAFYLYKLVLPLHLTVAYNRAPPVALSEHWAWFTWIAPLTVGVLAFLWRRKVPWLLASLGVYWLAVLPVLGLVPFDFQDFSTVADHYLYLAMLGPAIAVAFLMARNRSRACSILSVMVLAALAVRSWAQSHVWHDAVSLDRHEIAINPHQCAGYNNLGGAYLDRHEAAQAIDIYEQGLTHSPDCVPLQLSLAPLLANAGRFDEAAELFKSAGRYAGGEELQKVIDGLAKISQMRREVREQKSKPATTSTTRPAAPSS